MRILPLLLLMPAFLAAQPVTPIGEIPRGVACFYSDAHGGLSTLEMGGLATFVFTDGVHAVVNPAIGMQGLPLGQNSYIVQVSLNGEHCADVEVELPPVGPSQRVLSFPVIPAGECNRLPQLAAAIGACPRSKWAFQRVSAALYLKRGRIYLGSGEFLADRHMRVWEQRGADHRYGIAGPMRDTTVTAFVVGELARDFPHLELVQIEAATRWHGEPTSAGTIIACTIRYTVRDNDGNCYQGYSGLRRAIHKRKGLGPVLGDVWPNARVDCD